MVMRINIIENKVIVYLIGFGQLEKIQSIGVPLVDDVSQSLSFEGSAVATVTVHRRLKRKKIIIIHATK
jgi:hypothetical protein